MFGLVQGKENPPQHLAFPNLVANKSLCAKYFRRDVKRYLINHYSRNGTWPTENTIILL